VTASSNPALFVDRKPCHCDNPSGNRDHGIRESQIAEYQPEPSFTEKSPRVAVFLKMAGEVSATRESQVREDSQRTYVAKNGITHLQGRRRKVWLTQSTLQQSTGGNHSLASLSKNRGNQVQAKDQQCCSSHTNLLIFYPEATIQMDIEEETLST
jgi:hypothetical protein